MYNRQQAMKQTLILGIYFMLIYTTYLSFSNIITYIAQHEEGQYNYGPLVALATNNSVYFVTLIFSSAITNFKKQFQISAICHLVNYLVYIPDFKGDLGLIAGIIGAIFGGYGAGIYWVSQGGYLMKLFKTYGIKEKEEGKYFGVANAIVYFSSFFGAVVATFGVGIFGNQIYFIMLSVLSVLSWMVCTFFLDSLQNTKDERISILTNSPSSANINQDIIETQYKKQKKSYWQITKTTFINTVKYYPQMYYLWLPIIFQGFIAGFINSYITRIIPENIRTSLNVGYMLMILGIGCTIGAFLSATLSDRFSVLNISKFGSLFFVVCTVLTYLNSYYKFQQLYFPYFVAFCWGFVINYITSMQSVSCAKINKGNLYSFSIARQISALSFVGFTVFMIIKNNQINLMYFMIIMIFLAIISVLVVSIFENNQRKVQLVIEQL